MDRTGGGGDGPYGSTYTGIAAREEATIKKIEDRHVYKVINNLTDPCAKSIFNELEIEMVKKGLLQKIMQPTAKVNLTFAESILKLFNDSNTFNLSITNGYLKDSNGSTSGASITVSDSYLKNATQLSVARTMIHEMVHAYLNVKYGNAMSFDNGIDFRLKMKNSQKTMI